MDALGPWHLLIIVGVFVLLFGAKKLPEAARSLGKSAKILKTELHGLHDDGHATVAPIPAVHAPVAAAAPAAQPLVATPAELVTPAEPVAAGERHGV